MLIHSGYLEQCHFVHLRYDIDDMGFRGHDSKLFKRRFRLVITKFVFSNRVINSWNSLPTQCVNCNTVDTFKKYISTAMESETDVNS